MFCSAPVHKHESMRATSKQWLSMGHRTSTPLLRTACFKRPGDGFASRASANRSPHNGGALPTLPSFFPTHLLPAWGILAPGSYAEPTASHHTSMHGGAVQAAGRRLTGIMGIRHSRSPRGGTMPSTRKRRLEQNVNQCTRRCDGIGDALSSPTDLSRCLAKCALAVVVA